MAKDNVKTRISRIENDVQDRDSLAWKKLCDYVDDLARGSREEFAPRKLLGEALFREIHTLPGSIAKLKQVKRVLLYGSKLKRIPPEIGQMASLEYLDVYTSYDLHWLPYEVAHCRQLRDSRITYEETNQLWVTLRIGTDIVPLLANVCSIECEERLPKPPENYVQFPHKGGGKLVQPPAIQ